MSQYAIVFVLIGGLLLVVGESCIPPTHTGTYERVTPEEFNRLFDPDHFYGYDGNGRVSYGHALGSSDFYITIRQVSINRTLDIISVAGNVQDQGTREGIPEVNILIGVVEYINGQPYRILAKKRTNSGADGAFTIESKLEPGDRMFFAARGYIMDIAEVSELLSPD